MGLVLPNRTLYKSWSESKGEQRSGHKVNYTQTLKRNYQEINNIPQIGKQDLEKKN